MVHPTQYGLKKAMGSKTKKPASMTDEQWWELDENALLAIQLCWAAHALREVLDKTTTVDIWLGLDTLYMTKSPINKISLKEHLYMFSMAEDTPIQNNLHDFNFDIIDLESLDVTLEDEDKAILFVVLLSASCKHFKEILLDTNNDTLSFEDVKANLLSKETFDFEVCAEKRWSLISEGWIFW